MVHNECLVIAAELEKLCSEGIGLIVTREEMINDKVLPTNQCCSVYVKPEISVMDVKFFDMVSDKDINREMYEVNFNKPLDDSTKRIVLKYHPHSHLIPITQDTQQTAGK